MDSRLKAVRDVNDTIPLSMTPVPPLSVHAPYSKLKNDSEAIVIGYFGETRREARILIDTGADNNYIDQGFVERERLDTTRLEVPRRLTMFDGSSSGAGEVTEVVKKDVAIEGVSTNQAKFDVTRLAGSDAVLGLRWMKENGVVIDCGQLKMFSRSQGGAASMEERESQVMSSQVEPSQVMSCPVLEPSSTLVESGSSNEETRSESVAVEKTQQESNLRATGIYPSHVVSNGVTIRYPNSIPLVGPNRYEEATRRNSMKVRVEEENQMEEENQVEVVEPVETVDGRLCAVVGLDMDPLDDISVLPSFDSFELTKDEMDDIRRLVPEDYHEFLDVFNPRVATETLPPHREYDMTFELKPEATLRVAPLYNLEPEALEAVRSTIERELKAGRIRRSNAAYGAPTFTVRKKDGRFRMVVDYRALNKATVGNAYPLPVIEQAFELLRNAKYYSKFDIVSAYQLLRVATGHEKYTAFRTLFGMFESMVLRDGLKNAPSVFQQFLNELFRDLLGKGILVYVDDILVYAITLKELRRLTRIVLERMRMANLFFKAAKCEFERTEVKFLGMVVSNKGIGPDADYVRAVTEFPAPRNLGESRRFVGMASYYRKFVPNFSLIARPLNRLTGKDVRFVWTEVEQEAFDMLKMAMTTSPVLAHFDPRRETIVQTDASIFGWGFIISQINAESKEEHPIVMESGSFSAAEFNYTTTEKEFLAIVHAFKRKRHLLIQVSSTVVTDHLNLTYWMEPRQLNQRQARWVDLMSGFDFTIVYRPGSKAAYPDGLSRNPDYSKGRDSNENLVQALPRFDENSRVQSSTGVVLRALLSKGDEPSRDWELVGGEDEETDELDGARKEIDALEVGVEVEAEEERFPQLFRLTRRMGFDSPKLGRDKHGRLLVDDRVYVPGEGGQRLDVLRSHHDSALAGHQGIGKTLELIHRGFCWLGLRRDVEQYIRGCSVCQRTKTSRQKPQGLLQPVEIAEAPWTSISMDFIEELPESDGYNSILVVVDRLTKWAIFIPTTTRLKASGLVDLIVDKVVTVHGLPRSIVSDRGSKFTSRLWGDMCESLGIQAKLSTSFHPQTDGQTERVNQVLEQYIRVFGNYKQDDWARLLQRASFSYNNSLHSGIGMSPFLANYGYNPRWVDELVESTSDAPLVIEKVEDLKGLHEMCRANIELANMDYAKYYDRKHREQVEFKVGDLVLLSMENIRTRRPMKKLDAKFSGPHSIIGEVGPRAFRLELPESMRCHNVFHVSQLRPFFPPQIDGQSYEPPGPVEVEGDEESFEVKAVVDSRLVGRGKKKSLEYLVEWLGYENTEEAVGWEPVENLDGASEAIEEFHAKFPDKPSPLNL